METLTLTPGDGDRVRFDLAGLVTQLQGQVQKAEVLVRVGRAVRRIGNDLVRIAGEMEGAEPEFRELGMDGKKLAQPVRRVAAEILANSQMPIDQMSRQIELMTTMIEFGEGVEKRLERQARELAEKWDVLVAELNAVLVKGGNWDLPFAVRVEKKEVGRREEEIWVGRESGTTYWHNLRSNAIRLWGSLSEEDNRVWLDAKRRLASGEAVVKEGVWTFYRE